MHRILRYRVRGCLQLTILLALVMVTAGCVSITTADLIPESIILSSGNYQREGAVNIQAVIYPVVKELQGTQTLVRIDWPFDAPMLKDALAKSIIKHGIFTKVSPDRADYVLDVQVEKVVFDFKMGGEGYVYNLSAIWRLTRVKDRKVIFCDFANGHGASRGFGINASTVSLGAATRNMIQNGLSMLSDQQRAAPQQSQESQGETKTEKRGLSKKQCRDSAEY